MHGRLSAPHSPIHSAPQENMPIAVSGSAATATPPPLDVLDALRNVLQALIEDALCTLVPRDVVESVLRQPRDTVRSAMRPEGADFRCRACRSIYARLAGKQKAADAAKHRLQTFPTARESCQKVEEEEGSSSSNGSSSNTNISSDGHGSGSGSGGGGIVVHTVSPMGVERVRNFCSALELARAVILALPEESTSWVADVRASADGELHLTSLAQMAAQRREGRLFCRDCARFFTGDKGLRDHRQIKHGQSYEHSRAVVAAARAAIIPAMRPPLIGIKGNNGGGAAAAASLAMAAQAAMASTAAAPLTTRASALAELSPELICARDGSLDGLKRAVASGWDAKTACDRNGSTALLWAAGGGHLDCCRFLVESCKLAPDGVQSRDERCALHWAARNGRLDVVRWLVLEQNVDVNAITRNGTTPFHLACYQGQEETCRLLLSLGACATTLNRFGCNALQWAAHSGNVHMCRFLVSQGVDASHINNNGHSVLHKAAIKGQHAVCQFFLDEASLGPEHLHEDIGGHTPAEMARLNGHNALAKWLTARARAVGVGTTIDNIVSDQPIVASSAAI